MKTGTSIEPLEARIAPAATFTYADVDGDFVTIKTSKGSDGELSLLLTLAPEGLGMELREIDFSANSVVFFGTDLTVTAKRTSAGGDGRVNVGYIDATVDDGNGAALNLGNVRIAGDLGRIDAGTSGATVAAVKSLTVQSMGEFGTSTQGASAGLLSFFRGPLGKLVVAGNIREASVLAVGTGIGKIGSVSIGGSLIGGAASDSGQIFSAIAMGPVKIAGNIEGGDGLRSGYVWSKGTLTSITLGGSIFGGPAGSSGGIESDGAMGQVKIGGNIEGGDFAGAADLEDAGFIEAQRIAGLFVGGSIIAGINSGTGTLANSGSVRATDDIGPIVVKGSLVGNSTNPVLITARGQAVPGAATDLAIKSLTVSGRVEFTDILAGYDNDTPLFGVNADAQIGAVVVGDWIASNLVAGVQDDNDAMRDALFGDANDVKIIDADDAANVVSKIASITIKGTARGTIGGNDHFGFVAQQIGSLKIGGAIFPLVSGAASAIDITGYAVGITGDLRLREVAL